jgi:hypothetical protein
MPSHCGRSQPCLPSSLLLILAFDFLSRQDVQASFICVRFGFPLPRGGGFSLRLGGFLRTPLLPAAGSRSPRSDMRLESLKSLI